MILVLLIMVAFDKPITESASAQTSPPRPIELAYTLHQPAPPPPPARGTADVAATEWWAKEVEAKTAGRVKVKFYWGGVLGKPSDFLRMVEGGGVANMGNIVGTYNQWELPLFAGSMLAFLTKDLDVQMRAITKLYDEWGPMREEWSKHNIKPLWWYVIDPYWLVCKKPTTKFDDMHGQKIAGYGGFGEIIRKFGITQVSLPSPDAYEALQKQVLDAIIFPYGPIKTFKFYETCKVFVDLSFCGGQTAAAQAINLNVWNKISPADQKAIEEISAKMHNWFLKYYEEDRKLLTDFYKKEGITFIAFSPGEEVRVKNICAEEIWNGWVTKCKEKSVLGEEFLKRYQAIVKELTKR
jgi:TRAP-type C4-dicarboxylate transport system substrate-binding protein